MAQPMATRQLLANLRVVMVHGLPIRTRLDDVVRLNTVRHEVHHLVQLTIYAMALVVSVGSQFDLRWQDCLPFPMTLAH